MHRFVIIAGLGLGAAGTDTVPSHVIVGSTWDRLHEAAFQISSALPACRDMRGGFLTLMDTQDRVRGFEGTQMFTADDPQFGQQGLAFSVNARIRISDMVYPPGSQYADSLQRVIIHEMAHVMYDASETVADAWEVTCEGSDTWKIFGQ